MGEGIWIASCAVFCKKQWSSGLFPDALRCTQGHFTFLREEAGARQKPELHTKNLQGKVKFLTGGDDASASEPATRQSLVVCD